MVIVSRTIANIIWEIAREKINQIFTIWPLLEKEIEKKNESQTEINLLFKNNSNFDVLTVTSKSRGSRRNTLIVDEVRDHDPNKLNPIVKRPCLYGSLG